MKQFAFPKFFPFNSIFNECVVSRDNKCNRKKKTTKKFLKKNNSIKLGKCWEVRQMNYSDLKFASHVFNSFEDSMILNDEQYLYK